MKINILVFGLLLALPFSASAQNKQLDFKWGIKLYNTSSYSENTTTNYGSDRTKEKVIELFKPSIAVQVKAKNKNFHEVELSNFQLNENRLQNQHFDTSSHSWHTIDNHQSTYANIQLRYEYILNFNKKKDSRWLPALGLSAMPYFSYGSGKSTVSSLFPRSETHIGVKGFVVPRLSYRFSKRFFAEINLPISLGGLAYIHQNRQDPSLSKGQQSFGIIDFNAVLQPYQLRLGIGLRL